MIDYEDFRAMIITATNCYVFTLQVDDYSWYSPEYYKKIKELEDAVNTLDVVISYAKEFEEMRETNGFKNV